MLCHLCAQVDVISACKFSCRVLVRGVSRVLCLLCIALLLFVLSLYFLVCVYLFQYFSIFSLLCYCVGQALFGRIKIVSVIAFFLMKNVLRHGRNRV